MPQTVISIVPFIPRNKHNKQHEQVHGETFKLKILDGPTSVENLAHTLFNEISALGFQLVQLEVKETDTSIVEYTLEDWKKTNGESCAVSTDAIAL